MPVQRASRKKHENSRYTLALATAILRHDSNPTNICIQGANLMRVQTQKSKELPEIVQVTGKVTKHSNITISFRQDQFGVVVLTNQYNSTST